MIATHLGFYNTASSRTHVRFQFSTHAAAGGNVAPNSAFEAADLRIYKAADGAAFSATQRSSANGITMTSPFDSLTGFHDVDIDLADNTDAGFYAAGSLYAVVLAPDETVDGQTITGVVLAYFEIGVQPANVTQFGGTAGTFASGRPEVNATHISGDSAAADNAEAFFDGTGYAGTNNVIPTVTNLTNKGDGSGFTAIPWNSAWDAEVQSEVADALGVYDPPTRAELTSDINSVLAILGTPAGASLAADVAAVKTVADAIKAKTDNLPADPADASDIAAALAALNDLSAAQVNAEIVDALATDTYGEPTGVPGATIALSAKISWLYMALRNGVTVTSSKKQFLDDSGAAEWEKDLSDDGTTYAETKGNAP